MSYNKYPSTPYWPWSPSTTPNDKIISDPSVFVGPEVVITEKLDGSNTLLVDGAVYGRSVSVPTTNKWMAMVKKHHAWKSTYYPYLKIYGEDIFGVHSIEYDPVREDETFYMFALRRGDVFDSYRTTEHFAQLLNFQMVPLLYRGTFNSIEDIRDMIDKFHQEESVLGGEREGVVMRLASDTIHLSDFNKSVCKSVRPDHVKTDQHWRKHWKPCKLIKEK